LVGGSTINPSTFLPHPDQDQVFVAMSDSESEEDMKSAFWEEMQARFGGPISYDQIRQWEQEQMDGEEEEPPPSDSPLLRLTPPRTQGPLESSPSQAQEGESATRVSHSSVSSALPATGWLTPATPRKAARDNKRPSRRDEPTDLMLVEVQPL
jgi:hypothetical protein